MNRLSDRKNNFDFIRIVLACLVFLAHLHDLNSNTNTFNFLSFISSVLAIKGFFIISGYLITTSYYNNEFNLKKYYLNRFARIYPAYIVVVLLSFMFLSLLSSSSIADYLLNYFNLKYLISNLMFLNFLQPGLEGVFEHNPMPAINGALWTIKIEVMFYLILPLIIKFLHSMSSKNKIIILSAIYCLSIAYSYFFSKIIVIPTLEKQLPGHMDLFACGILCYYIKDDLKKYCNWLILPCIVALFFESYFHSEIFKPISLTVFIMFIALNFKALNNFGKFGDFSFGIYLIHFPIIQTFIALGYFKENPIMYSLICFITILILSIISWNFIEKPSLKLIKNYQRLN